MRRLAAGAALCAFAAMGAAADTPTRSLLSGAAPSSPRGFIRYHHHEGPENPLEGMLSIVNRRDSALEVRNLREAAEAAPEVRVTLVRALRERIQRGLYRVDDAAVARCVVEEWLEA